MQIMLKSERRGLLGVKFEAGELHLQVAHGFTFVVYIHIINDILINHDFCFRRIIAVSLQAPIRVKSTTDIKIFVALFESPSEIRTLLIPSYFGLTLYGIRDTLQSLRSSKFDKKSFVWLPRQQFNGVVLFFE